MIKLCLEQPKSCMERQAPSGDRAFDTNFARDVTSQSGHESPSCDVCLVRGNGIWSWKGALELRMPHRAWCHLYHIICRRALREDGAAASSSSSARISKLEDMFTTPKRDLCLSRSSHFVPETEMDLQHLT